MNLNRMASFGFVLAIATVIMVLAASGRTTDARDPIPDGWPSFQMTYIEKGYFHGLSEPTESMTWSLLYESISSWEKVLVDTTIDPTAIGDTYRLESGGLIIDQSSHTDDVIRRFDDAQVISPDSWLAVGRESFLEDNGFTRIELPQTHQVMYERVFNTDCRPDLTGQVTGVSQPDSCVTSPTYEIREVYVYDTSVDPAIPIEVTTVIDGKYTSSVTVTELTITSSEPAKVIVSPST